MKELVRYLLQNMYLDFQGDIEIDRIRKLLREDPSREAKLVLDRLVKDGGADELLMALADILKEHIRTGISEDVMREQIVGYSES